MTDGTPRFDTSQLAQLRELLEKFGPAFGSIVQFRVIVDANFVLQELMYRVKHAARGASAFQELVRATVVQPYAPRWLEVEMHSAIRQVAAKGKVREADLLLHWEQFRTLLIWEESLAKPGPESEGVCDPKDAPYILLEKLIAADGILSRDKHIARMGGHPLTLDFVLSARGYARNVVVTVSIRLFGSLAGALAIKAFGSLLGGAARSFASLPNSVKATLLATATIALLHPTSRNWILERCEDLGALLLPVWHEIQPSLAALGSEYNRAQSESVSHFAAASRAVRSKVEANQPQTRTRQAPGAAPRRRRRPIAA